MVHIVILRSVKLTVTRDGEWPERLLNTYLNIRVTLSGASFLFRILKSPDTSTFIKRKRRVDETPLNFN